ncbi:ATP-binding cassette domain-containing protein, partial [Candidatus Sumerlaeota bacterium]|nr:ATP-binding cassette domain-containing protein [Candidatus Sumerlaeota bacterium]
MVTLSEKKSPAAAAARRELPPEIKIQAESLNFYYGPSQALFGISMSLPARNVTALIGPSGCGKSTFLRTLNRMNDIIPATRLDGRVTIDDEDIYSNQTDV